MKKKIVLLSFVAMTAFAVAGFAKTKEDCKLTVKNNQTGESYTITVHGTSCAALIKSLVK